MLFNSVAFAVFLPVTFGVFWLCARRSVRAQNLLVLAASYLFYGWWDWRFLGLIVLSSAVDYSVGLALGRARDGRGRRWLLGISLAVNLGLLGFFKYFDFFVESFAELLGGLGLTVHAPTLRIVLPVGISFYTFQTLSYTIDIYRRRVEPTRDALAFFTFVAFFPQLVAGPIERARHLLPQFLRPRAFSYAQAASGLRLMLWGFVKKLVIADRLAPLVEVVYGDPAGSSGGSIALASLAFTLQIYGDFSGYSDIAIGTGRLFGIDLMTNFRTPYFATSLREHWQRWHISLSTWFRDYLYIPLGGNRAGPLRRTCNVVLTFTVSGLWHGTTWPFVLWGFAHGAAYVVEDAARKRLSFLVRLPAFLGWLWMFLVVCLCFVLFRAAGGMGTAQGLFHGLWTWQDGSLGQTLEAAYGSLRAAAWVLASVVLFLGVELRIGRGDADGVVAEWPRPLRWAFYYALVVWILLLGQLGAGPQFIYFQF